MKNIFFTLAFIGSVSVVFSQTVLTDEQYKFLVDENTSLRKASLYLNQQIDSLEAQYQKLDEDNATIRRENETAKKDVNSLSRKLAAINTNREEDSLRIQNLETGLNEKKEELASLKQEKERSDREQYLKGQQYILNALTRSYETLSFDEMIEASSQEQISRDRRIVDDAKLKRQMKDLEIYFSGKEVLAQKFDLRDVQFALEMTGTVKEESPLVKSLADNLDNYKLRNDGLKEAIQKIQVIDEKFIANNDNDQKDKETRILSEISWYFYNYEFDFEDYPYLLSKAIEIMKAKHKDANSDISGILEQL
jgi:hypothetical protein